MSGNLSRLKFASVEPPPFVWDKIERRLNSDKVPEEISCFAKLHDCSIAPPADVRNRLFEELDSIMQSQPLSAPLYTVRKKNAGIHFPVVKKSKIARRIYWGMTGIIVASALIFSYLVLNSNGLSEAEKPSVKKPSKNEEGGFIPTSVSGKSSGEFSL